MPSIEVALLAAGRKLFHADLLNRQLLTLSSKGVPSIADADNKDSCAIARELLTRVGTPEITGRLAPQAAGSQFEAACTAFLENTFPQLSHLRPGQWAITHVNIRDRVGIARYEQYAHLAAISDACAAQPQLAAALGRDYLIGPDIVILREPETDEQINRPREIVDETVARLTSLRKLNGGLQLIHASISCKLTIRSDRAQNSRSEALNLIRNRKGRVPHIAVVTAEPLPSRLSSLALGTGDIDCVYHIALPELQSVVEERASDDSKESLKIMVDGKRLRDISDLPLDLSI